MLLQALLPSMVADILIMYESGRVAPWFSKMHHLKSLTLH